MIFSSAKFGCKRLAISSVLLSKVRKLFDFSKWQLLIPSFPLELSDLLPLVKVCEALLRVKNGPYLICRLLANMPHSYKKSKLMTTLCNVH